MLLKSRHGNFPQFHPAATAASAGRVVPGIQRAGQPAYDPRRRALSVSGPLVHWQPAGEALHTGRIVPGIMRCARPGRNRADRHYLRTPRLAPLHTGQSPPAPVVHQLPPRIARCAEPLRGRRGWIFTNRPPVFHTGSTPPDPNPIANLRIRAAFFADAPRTRGYHRTARLPIYRVGLANFIVPQWLQPRRVHTIEPFSLRRGSLRTPRVRYQPTRNLNYYAGLGDSWYRVANDALTGYLLYRGQDGAPDFEADPWESFAGLPHTTSNTLNAGHAWHLVLRRRNKFNLVSQNIRATIVETDADGDRVYRPHDPQEATLSASDGGTARLRAYYFYALDGDHAGDTWRIYLRSDGNDPEPANDSPTDVTMTKADGIAKLDWQSSTYAAGTVITVILHAYNSATGAESDGTTVLSAVMATAGPDTPDSGAFLNSLALQV